MGCKGCYNCGNLDVKNKKAGAVDGSLYFCKKLKKYVNPATDECEKWEKSYNRKSYENDDIYKDGKKYYNDNTPTSLYVILLIIVVIVCLVLSLFNK